MEQSIVYNVHDLKVYPITDPGDSSTDPTYGTPVDVPGVSEVTLDAQVVEAMLKGDGSIIDQRAILEAVTLSFTYGKLAPDVLAVVDGGTVSTNVGSTTTRYVRTAGDKVPAFGLAAKVEEVDNPGGAAKMYLYNGKITGGGIFAAQTDEYGEPSFDVRGIKIPNGGAIFAVDLEDVGADLPADSAALIATWAALV